MFADAVLTKTDLWVASARRETQGLNAVHQIMAVHRPTDERLSVMLDSTTSRAYKLVPNGPSVWLQLDQATADGKEEKAVIQRISLRTGEPTGEELNVPGGLTATVFTPDARRVIGVTARDKSVRCWSLPDGKELWNRPLPNVTDRFAAAVSADGETVAVAASFTPKFDVAGTGSSPPPGSQPPRRPRALQDNSEVEQLVKQLETDMQTGVSVFRVRSGELVRRLPTSTGDKVVEVGVSHDGRLVLAKVDALVTTRDTTQQRNDVLWYNLSGSQIGFHRAVRMDVRDSRTGNLVHQWPDVAFTAFAPDRPVLAIAEQSGRRVVSDAEGRRTVADRTGRLGFWHFDPAPAKK